MRKEKKRAGEGKLGAAFKSGSREKGAQTTCMSRELRYTLGSSSVDVFELKKWYKIETETEMRSLNR
jgi:hypothetical protein